MNAHFHRRHDRNGWSGDRRLSADITRTDATAAGRDVAAAAKPGAARRRTVEPVAAAVGK
ncbi:hypothetical protein RHIZ404_190369 [Rhizobium sp. EC-SD404]|nr:hypothetical protein RHIZ404_190369 [Rhizobium sp. EC-SD404]